VALGLLHVRGKLCKYTGGKRKGQFVRCTKAGKRGHAAKPKRSSTTGGNCKLVKQRMFGKGNKKVCRKICWRGGKIASNKPSKGCR
jgi:hypothetical protein